MLKKNIFLLMILASTVSLAQRIKIDKKKLQFLKEETVIGVQLTFPEDVTFYAEKMTEKEFVSLLKKRRSSKDVSKGDAWLKAYEEAKERTWRDDFLGSINEELAAYSDVRFSIPNEKTNYVLLIEANWIYPGYGGKASVGRQQAKLEVTLKFVKQSDPEHVLFETVSPKIIGDYTYGEFGTLLRIGECYDRLGFVLNLQLKRILK